MVGLSCAWSLQEQGVEVEVVDRRHPGAGASWGNAGFVAPALTLPLSEPSILRHGLRGLIDPRSPICVPLPASTDVLAFLARTARNCTRPRWRRAVSTYCLLNEQIFAAFEAQRDGGVQAATVEAEIVAGFRRAPQASGLLAELQELLAAGQSVDVDMLTGDQARGLEPHLSEAIGVALRIRRQGYIAPAAYVAALAEHVRQRGGAISEGTTVTEVRRRGERIVVHSSDGERDADAVVLANGAWLSQLARPHGVRTRVQAGRGYSFSVPCDRPLRGPVYLPGPRVAIAPQRDRARLTGVMEFADADAVAGRSRIASIVRSVRPLLTGVDLDDREDEWVGPRPLTPDGVPLVGPTRTRGVYVAGGHGMWGVTLGPLTGRLLAEQIVAGRTPRALARLDPLR
jgi:D-amino-acid dehydrogenase